MREFKNQIDEKCLQDEPAFCTAACPFSFDIRDFAAKLQRGGFGAAYRAYVNTVAFPGIVSRFCDEPCKGACIRSQTDDAISLRKLEAAAVQYAPNPRPNSYSMPKKDKKIAVIGAGLSGLGCALRMASQKYDVTVYEQSDRIGGRLWELCPEGDFTEEIERQFQYEEYTLLTGTRVDSLDAIEWDAVYIATGKGGTDFGLKLTGEGAYASNRPGVFIGGEAAGNSFMGALADGLAVIHAIDRYIKTGAMNHPMIQKGTRLKMNTARIIPTPAVVAEGEYFTRDEAVEEAKRCLRCRCDACLRGCDLMGYFTKYPRRIEEEVEVTIHPGTLDGNGTVATRLISTCNHCGRCKIVCPAGLDVDEFLLANHKIMRENDAMPWVYHEFWLRDMEFSCGEEAELFRLPGGYKKSEYAFFPGCRLGGTLPDTVAAAYAGLLKSHPDTALMLSCCGAPAEWAGDEPVHEVQIGRLSRAWEDLGRPKLLFACESCRRMFEKHLPEIDGISIYTFLAGEGFAAGPQQGIGQRRDASVFDPCSSRDNPGAQDAVRGLLKGVGYEISPLLSEGKYASCCGFGGQVSIANPHYAREVALARIAQSELPYIVYCGNCRDVFASYGKPVVHLLEILFGDMIPDAARPAPTPTESRENRRNLRRRLCMEFWQEHTLQEDTRLNNINNLIISQELHEKLAKEMILEEDISEVIAYCEETGKKLYDPEKETFIGHKQVGSMTFWAEYRFCEEECQLVGAYGHRMNLATD